LCDIAVHYENVHERQTWKMEQNKKTFGIPFTWEKVQVYFRRSFISVLPKNKMILKGNLQISFQGFETNFF
jgi:hypothetical protein